MYLEDECIPLASPENASNVCLQDCHSLLATWSTDSYIKCAKIYAIFIEITKTITTEPQRKIDKDYQYSPIPLYQTRLYWNPAYIEVQALVPPNTMLINIPKAPLYVKLTSFESWLYHSCFLGPANQKPVRYIEVTFSMSKHMYHCGPLRFGVTGIYCKYLIFVNGPGKSLYNLVSSTLNFQEITPELLH